MIIDNETERIEMIHKDNIEIATLFKSVNNAYFIFRLMVICHSYKLYFKNRPEPSTRSVARAKEFNTRVIHPLFLDLVSKDELDREHVRETLHEVRPNSTIWEDEKSSASAVHSCRLLRMRR